MRLEIDQKLLDFQLYRDFASLSKLAGLSNFDETSLSLLNLAGVDTGASLEQVPPISKLYVKEIDEFLSAFAPNLSEGDRRYLFMDLLASKGTTKVFKILEDHFDFQDQSYSVTDIPEPKLQISFDLVLSDFLLPAGDIDRGLRALLDFLLFFVEYTIILDRLEYDFDMKIQEETVNLGAVNVLEI